MSNIKLMLCAGALAVGFAACESAEQNFPDYDGGTTAYFAYQYPIRTLILGNVETYDNTSDNDGRFTIYGTCGGSYSGINAKINVSIDETLTKGLYFEDGSEVKPMPKDYYEVSGDVLDYGGGFRGGVEVKLNEKFFNDPLSLKNTYVIPMVMGDYSGVDHINRGTPVVEGSSPLRQDPEKWDPAPKDYTLFCVNYINEYTSTYLRRGKDDFDKLQFEDKVVGKESCIVIHATAKKQNAWDNQFWINVDHTFAADEEYTLSMRIKATAEAKSSTQVHNAPSEYRAGFGDVTFTTDWTPVTVSGKFAANQAGGHSIAFNLNEIPEANDYYLDDISFVIGGVEYITNIKCDSIDSDNFYSKVDDGAINKSEFEVTPLIERINLGYGKATASRHGKFIERDEVVYTSSLSRNQVLLPIATTEVGGVNTPCELVLTFNGDDCTITSNNEALCTASGTGKYVKNGEPLAWGNKDRDVLYLDYTIDFKKDNVHYATKDTLVWRDRGTAAAIHTFKPVFKSE